MVPSMLGVGNAAAARNARFVVYARLLLARRIGDDMYFNDLMLSRYHAGPYDDNNWRVPLLTVGWLEHPHDYPRGTAPSGLVDKLDKMVAAARTSQPDHNFRGLYRCSFCQATEGDGKNLPDSHVNVFVPGQGVVYLAPSGIRHYLDVHSYLPPSTFVEAVMQCDDYGSPAYYEQLWTANNGERPPIESTVTMRAQSNAKLAAWRAERVRGGFRVPKE
jgi:hypothetical protein